MLLLPQTGFLVSTKHHNVRLDIAADWIEASVGFVDNFVSQGDVVDSLRDNGVYENQSFATERVSDVWVELERREGLLGQGALYKVNGRVVERVRDWESVPAYSFCLIVSLQAWYADWASKLQRTYGPQGALFERITVECLEWLGWEVLSTGWSSGTSRKIQDVIKCVSQHCGERERREGIEYWASKKKNEAGLDVVCFDPFPDRRGGCPLYFFQCASGANWDSKLSEPDLALWGNLIAFTNTPKRGFALPFSLLDDDFRKNAATINGFLLDRYRLLIPGASDAGSWESSALRKDLKAWLRPRVKALGKVVE